MGIKLVPMMAKILNSKPLMAKVENSRPKNYQLIQSETTYIPPSTRTGKLIGFLGLFTYANEE